jgi:3-oxoadipate enol-lactonase
MPTASNDGVSVYYEAAGDADRETVVLVGDAGYGAWQWAWQHGALTGPFETVVTDLRGTGRSDAPPGPYTVSDLAADVASVLADHGARRVHLVGRGLGGMVALALARESGRVRSLALLGTAARGEGLTLDSLYGDPADPDALAASLDSALGEAFRDANPDALERIVAWRAEEDAPRSAWAAQADAVAGFDATDWLYEVDVPALVLHGTADEVWPVERGRRLAEGLPLGEFVGFDAGHLVGVERARAVNDRLVGWVESA